MRECYFSQLSLFLCFPPVSVCLSSELGSSLIVLEPYVGYIQGLHWSFFSIFFSFFKVQMGYRLDGEVFCGLYVSCDGFVSFLFEMDCLHY